MKLKFSDHSIEIHRITSLSERELEVLFPIVGERQKFKAALKVILVYAK